MASTTEYPSLRGFKALSFDCYGTIIDWVSGLANSLKPFTSLLPASHKYNQSPTLAVIRVYDISNDLETAHPTLGYAANLSQSLETLAAEEGITLAPDVVRAFGASPGTWTPFPDSVRALAKLSRHFRLFILSNVDEANIASTVARLEPVKFSGVYTAEAIGSYKPARQNFEYLFRHVKEDEGIDWQKGELLHVARSLTADHVTCKEIGLRSVWISRGGNKKEGEGVGGDLERLKGEGRLGFEWRFDDLAQFAEEVERQLGSGQ